MMAQQWRIGVLTQPTANEMSFVGKCFQQQRREQCSGTAHRESLNRSVHRACHTSNESVDLPVDEELTHAHAKKHEPASEST
jgi:hypothetical protein